MDKLTNGINKIWLFDFLEVTGNLKITTLKNEVEMEILKWGIN